MLHYIKSTPRQGLLRVDCDLQLQAYCDSNWASYHITQRSLTGFFVSLRNSSISWELKKQHIMFCSSAEAEYRSMVITCCELKWLR